MMSIIIVVLNINFLPFLPYWEQMDKIVYTKIDICIEVIYHAISNYIYN